MIKIIGAILLVGGAALMGISASMALSARARTLALFSQALEIMRSEIGEAMTPLEAVMEKLSHTLPAPLDGFFAACADAMKKRTDIPFGLIWKKQLKESESLKLGARETEELVSLGSILGRYSAEEQRISIERTSRCIASMAAAAESDRARLGGLYAKLGIICGISVVIVFI